MFCAFTRTKYQVSVYRTIGPLVWKPFNRAMVTSWSLIGTKKLFLELAVCKVVG